jgi:prevent-host-death family protein
MREIAISKFKSTCVAVIDEVNRTRKPIRITRLGKPVADLQPTGPSPKERVLGGMKGKMELDPDADIVGPIGAFEPWDPGEL